MSARPPANIKAYLKEEGRGMEGGGGVWAEGWGKIEREKERRLASFGLEPDSDCVVRFLTHTEGATQRKKRR